jgi:hypothetical protein
MHRNTRPRSIGRWPWCAMCGGNFRSIGYPFGRAEFCTKRCLDRYLADRGGQTEWPTSSKKWIEESRKKRNRRTGALFLQVNLHQLVGRWWVFQTSLGGCSIRFGLAPLAPDIFTDRSLLQVG